MLVKKDSSYYNPPLIIFIISLVGIIVFSLFYLFEYVLISNNKIKVNHLLLPNYSLERNEIFVIVRKVYLNKKMLYGIGDGDEYIYVFIKKESCIDIKHSYKELQNMIDNLTISDMEIHVLNRKVVKALYDFKYDYYEIGRPLE